MTRVISADCHINEPPHVFDRVPVEYRDRAPRMMRGEDGGDGWSFDGKPPKRTFGIEAMAGRARSDFQVSGLRFDEILPGNWDGAALRTHACGAVWHQAPDGVHARLARAVHEPAVPARVALVTRSVGAEHHTVAGGDGFDARPDRFDDARALVAGDHRQHARVALTVGGMDIGAAHPGGGQRHEHLARPGLVDRQRFEGRTVVVASDHHCVHGPFPGSG